MTRRKSEITARMNERDFPNVVELALPSGGFRSKSDVLLAFHRERRIEIRRSQGRNENGQFFIGTVSPIRNMPMRFIKTSVASG